MYLRYYFSKAKNISDKWFLFNMVFFKTSISPGITNKSRDVWFQLQHGLSLQVVTPTLKENYNKLKINYFPWILWTVVAGQIPTPKSGESQPLSAYPGQKLLVP